MDRINLESYLSDSVKNIVKDILKASLFSPSEAVYMAEFAKSAANADKLRKKAAERGEHIPPFLIASITSRCNLYCAGCYARSISSCEDSEPVAQLTAEEWHSVFIQAADMGISFILLAGGEPLVRRDVLEKAAEVKQIMFPVFTNGTMFNDNYIELFDKHRNLVPLISIEGGKAVTDKRRGDGIYDKTELAMARLCKQHAAFGASITVTTKNLLEVTGEAFVESLEKKGCKAILYVEYVPTSADSEYLAPSDKEREVFDRRIFALRKKHDGVLIIAFPGDERSSGGCLAAGRGFFHINSHGSAEPCPFSPYSDTNVRNTPLSEVMKSGFFTALRSSELLKQEHTGSCVLFGHSNEVAALLKSNNQ